MMSIKRNFLRNSSSSVNELLWRQPGVLQGFYDFFVRMQGEVIKDIYGSDFNHSELCCNVLGKIEGPIHPVRKFFDVFQDNKHLIDEIGSEASVQEKRLAVNELMKQLMNALPDQARARLSSRLQEMLSRLDTDLIRALAILNAWMALGYDVDQNPNYASQLIVHHLAFHIVQKLQRTVYSSLQCLDIDTLNFPRWTRKKNIKIELFKRNLSRLGLQDVFSSSEPYVSYYGRYDNEKAVDYSYKSFKDIRNEWHKRLVAFNVRNNSEVVNSDHSLTVALNSHPLHVPLINLLDTKEEHLTAQKDANQMTSTSEDSSSDSVRSLSGANFTDFSKILPNTNAASNSGDSDAPVFSYKGWGLTPEQLLIFSRVTTGVLVLLDIVFMIAGVTAGVNSITVLFFFGLIGERYLSHNNRNNPKRNKSDIESEYHVDHHLIPPDQSSIVDSVSVAHSSAASGLSYNGFEVTPEQLLTFVRATVVVLGLLDIAFMIATVAAGVNSITVLLFFGLIGERYLSHNKSNSSDLTELNPGVGNLSIFHPATHLSYQLNDSNHPDWKEVTQPSQEILSEYNYSVEIR